MKDFIHKEFPKSVGRNEFWKQIKRTVNGEPVSQSHIDQIVEIIRHKLKLEPNDNLLDLGCGNAALASYLFSDLNKYHGVDFSDYLLSVAKENFYVSGKTTYQNLNLREDYKSIKGIHSYNKVLIYGTFSYLGKTAGTGLLRHLCAVETVRDIFIGNIPDIEQAPEFFEARAIKDYLLDDEHSAIGVWWDFRELQNIFEKEGLTVRKSKMPPSFYASHYRFDLLASKCQGTAQS